MCIYSSFINTPKKICKNVDDAPYNPTANVHLTNVVSFVDFLQQHVLDILVGWLVNLFYPNLVYPTSNYSFACYALRKCLLKPDMIILALINYLHNIHITSNVLPNNVISTKSLIYHSTNIHRLYSSVCHIQNIE